MEINKLLTPHNYTHGTVDRIKYIVIHYVGATGGAEANCKYYAEKRRGASAHYFVGFDGEVWQSVEDHNIAWHCGGKKYANTAGGAYHGICTNANSIGIEMCVRKDEENGVWYFEDATVMSATGLTKKLMGKYNIPVDHVIRHYDVTGKLCPEPYVREEEKWKRFQETVATSQQQEPGWIKDDKGWWYRNADGSYPKQCWKWLQEKTSGTWGWYLFDHDGYMLKGYHSDENGNKYLLCPDTGINEGKCMVTNDQGVLFIAEYDMLNKRYIIEN